MAENTLFDGMRKIIKKNGKKTKLCKKHTHQKRATKFLFISLSYIMDVLVVHTIQPMVTYTRCSRNLFAKHKTLSILFLFLFFSLFVDTVKHKNLMRSKSKCNQCKEK